MPQAEINFKTKFEFNKRWNSLRNQYFNGWQGSHLDLSTYVDPKRGLFDSDPSARGSMINHQLLLDAYAATANQTLASALQSGMTSPSRPWHKWEFEEEEINDRPGAADWLDQLQKRSNKILLNSNSYSTLFSSYKELGQFGTSCFLMLEDFDTILRCRPFTAGEYYLGQDARGRVNAFARYFWMTAGQMVKEFGYESCSEQVRATIGQNQVDQWFKVCHLIEANDGRVEGMNDFSNMPFRSAYWEFGNTSEQFLAIRGYKRFPVIATRWETATTDQLYGFGPGWYALGSIKELQKTRLDKLLAQEKLHNPPMMTDSFVDGGTNFLPGGVTKSTSNIPNTGVRPAYQINPALESFVQLIQENHDAIDKFFFVDVFRMLMNMDQQKMTATEISERVQEKIMLMGPILYKIQEELLDPFMEQHFFIMQETGQLPPAPPSIQGAALKVRYVSVLAQAQLAAGVEQINRVAGFVGTYAAIAPQLLDILDWDEMGREVADMEGASPKIVHDEQTVAAIREQKAKQAQMEQMAQGADLAESASKTTKNLADSPVGEGSALDKILSGVKK